MLEKGRLARTGSPRRRGGALSRRSRTGCGLLSRSPIPSTSSFETCRPASHISAPRSPLPAPAPGLQGTYISRSGNRRGTRSENAMPRKSRWRVAVDQVLEIAAGRLLHAHAGERRQPAGCGRAGGRPARGTPRMATTEDCLRMEWRKSIAKIGGASLSPAGQGTGACPYPARRAPSPGKEHERRTFIAIARFLIWLRSFWQADDDPEGRWVMRTADSVLFDVLAASPTGRGDVPSRSRRVSRASGRVSRGRKLLSRHGSRVSKGFETRFGRLKTRFHGPETRSRPSKTRFPCWKRVSRPSKLVSRVPKLVFPCPQNEFPLRQTRVPCLETRSGSLPTSFRGLQNSLRLPSTLLSPQVVGQDRSLPPGRSRRPPLPPSFFFISPSRGVRASTAPTRTAEAASAAPPRRRSICFEIEVGEVPVLDQHFARDEDVADGEAAGAQATRS